MEEKLTFLAMSLWSKDGLSGLCILKSFLLFSLDNFGLHSGTYVDNLCNPYAALFFLGCHFKLNCEAFSSSDHIPHPTPHPHSQTQWLMKSLARTYIFVLFLFCFWQDSCIPGWLWVSPVSEEYCILFSSPSASPPEFWDLSYAPPHLVYLFIYFPAPVINLFSPVSQFLWVLQSSSFLAFWTILWALVIWHLVLKYNMEKWACHWYHDFRLGTWMPRRCLWLQSIQKAPLHTDLPPFLSLQADSLRSHPKEGHGQYWANYFLHEISSRGLSAGENGQEDQAMDGGGSRGGLGLDTYLRHTHREVMTSRFALHPRAKMLTFWATVWLALQWPGMLDVCVQPSASNFPIWQIPLLFPLQVIPNKICNYSQTEGRVGEERGS